jgi:carbohydrate-selective porin OprB
MLFFRAHYARKDSIEKDNEIQVSAAAALGNGLSGFECFSLDKYGSCVVTDEIAFPPTTQYIPTPNMMRQLFAMALVQN